MDSSPNLSLPYLAAAQAQKHVTHNEALRALDAIVQVGVVSRALTAPPAEPEDGDRYVVGADPSGDWAGHADELAAFQDGAWAFYVPRPGWLAWIADEEALVAWDGSDWVNAGGGSLNPASLVGVNATADATNRLSVKSDATLFSHDDVTPGSGDHQVKVNKASASDTASVLFQTDFSGRAEFGLAGDDDWHVKVSADGSVWSEVLIADRATGRLSFPNTPTREVLSADRTYYVRTDGNNANDGLSDSAGGAFLTIQKAVDVVSALDLSIHDVTIEVGDGTYSESLILGRTVGSGTVTIVGNTTTPTSCIISSGSNAVVCTAPLGAWAIRGFRLSASAYSLRADSGAGLYFQDIDFAAAQYHLGAVAPGAYVQPTGNYSISGGATFHIRIGNGGVVNTFGRTVTLTGTPAFTQYARVSYGFLEAGGMTFVGSATGSRYFVYLNGAANTGGGGASYFPGDSAGSVATGGQYS